MTKNSTEQIGLLGGSFDPVHCGHLGLARDVQNAFDLDRVLLVPANISPHKKKGGRADSCHRLNMLNLAVENEPDLAVSEIELDRGGISYTIDTLTALKTRHPNAEFTLTLGMDALLDIGNWRNWREIMERCHIAAAYRPGVKPPPLEEVLKRLFDGFGPYKIKPLQDCEEACFREDFQRRLAVFRPRPMEISSSEIRRLLSEKRPVKNLLPPKVERYIITHHLYQANSRPCKE